MKKIALAILSLGVSGCLLAAPNATIQYCDNNRNQAVAEAMTQMNLVLPDIVTNEVNRYMEEAGIPTVITNIDYYVEYHTNYVDNVISNYYHTNYVDNVISNYYIVTNYVEQVTVVSNYYRDYYNTYYTTHTYYYTNQPVNLTYDAGADFAVADTNWQQAISGDLGIYNIVVSTGQDSTGYWNILVDDYTGEQFIYESTYSESGSRYFRYKRVDGPTTTSGSNASMYYYGGLRVRFNYNVGNYFIYVYNDSGTLVGNNTTAIKATTINSSGAVVGGRKIVAYKTISLGERTGTLATLDDIGGGGGGSSEPLNLDSVTKVYKYDNTARFAKYNLSCTKYTYQGTSGGSASYSVTYYTYTFLLCSTNGVNTTISGDDTTVYQAYDFQRVSGGTTSDFGVSFNRNNTDGNGYFKCSLGSSMNGTSTPRNWLTIDVALETNSTFSVYATTSAGETQPQYDYCDFTLTYNSSVSGENQYISGDLGVYDNNGVLIDTLLTQSSITNIVTSNSNELERVELENEVMGVSLSVERPHSFSNYTHVVNTDLSISTMTAGPRTNVTSQLFPMYYHNELGVVYKFDQIFTIQSGTPANVGFITYATYRNTEYDDDPMETVVISAMGYSDTYRTLKLYTHGMTVALSRYNYSNQARYSWSMFFYDDPVNKTWPNPIPNIQGGLTTFNRYPPYKDVSYASNTKWFYYVRDMTTAVISTEKIDWIPTWNSITNWMETNYQRK